MTPAQAKRARAQLDKEIRADLKRKDRARLVELRARARELRAARAAAIVRARAACRRRRGDVPTLREAASMLRYARAEARATCDRELASAATVKDSAKRARAEHAAELAHQRTMRRLERQQKERKREQRPRLAKARTRQQESDDEVRGNIPPELVLLWERVKRQIKGSDRVTRTEAFLHYAEEHPDEEIAALEDKTDALIAELEARERGEPRRRANAPKLSPKASRRRVAALRKAGCHPRTVRLPDGSKAVLRDRGCKAPALRNPRQPPKAWWDRCIAGVRKHGRVKEPRAVCGAAWWNLPPARRAAIVRRLERSKDKRQRGAALALARAEKAHQARRGARPERRSNGRREVVSIVYEEQKPGDREPYEYEHEFEGERPELRMRGGALQIEGGSYTTRKGWIEG